MRKVFIMIWLQQLKVNTAEASNLLVVSFVPTGIAKKKEKKKKTPTLTRNYTMM